MFPMTAQNAPDSELRRRARQVHQALLQAFGRPKRPHLEPVDELVCTILSQNTNDTNRDRAFEALKARFPTWEAVRDANTEEVARTVRVAGLANQKAPRIQEALRRISEFTGGPITLDFLRTWPTEKAREWLMRLPGVGPKTAAIVLLFSLGKPAFPVDTHVYRVTGRLGLRPPRMSVEKAHAWLEQVFPPEAYYDAHLNLIRLGRTYCRPRHPRCQECPVRHLCPEGQKRLARDPGEDSGRERREPSGPPIAKGA